MSGPEVPKGAFFDCTICTLEYGLAQDRIPRVLCCGHTFCSSCLLKCIRMDSVSCPLCSYTTSTAYGDIGRIPVNYGILDMLRPQPNPPDEPEDEMCEACAVNPATVVCVSCSPIGVKFCGECDRLEHNRNFKPVWLHKRMALSDFDSTIICSRHPGEMATHYSENLNRFACHLCQNEPDWMSRCHLYLQIEDADQYLRAKAGKLHFKMFNAVRTLYDSQKDQESNLVKLAESASKARVGILQEFKKLTDILQHRQQILIQRVDKEYESRKESIQLQQTRIEERSQVVSSHHEALKSLLALPPKDFLRGYHHVIEGVLSLSQEDNILLRPIAPSDIPCFFRNNLEEELNAHGAVGGGPVPKNVVCNRVPFQQCTLPQLSWALDQDASDVNQYEVEYEYMPDERPPSPKSPRNSGPIDINMSKPMVVPKSGKAQAHVMNDLYPGFRYRFRVRSRNIAGWGMWSMPATGRFDGFPIRVAFTGEIISLRIPLSGMYRITAAGPKAADGDKFKGGRGASISGVFQLAAHDRIEIAVGGRSQKGTGGHSGGAGGTFVLRINDGHPSVDNILIVAGGGGGTRGYDDEDQDGDDASLETYGTNGRGKEHGLGGKEGLPGMDADLSYFQGPCWGYGGAGFSKSSRTAKCYVEGLEGGQCGGYGGGGGVGMLGGGGGGGFSGGGGGRGGGGGGSFINKMAVDVSKTISDDDHGYVLIRRVSPETHDTLATKDETPVNGGGVSTRVSSGNSSPTMCTMPTSDLKNGHNPI